MNSAEDVRAALNSGRNLQLEMAEATTSVDTLAGLLTGMANAKGGTLLLGVDAHGQPAGLVSQHQAEEMADNVLAAAFALDPALILPLPRTIVVDRAHVVVVIVPRGMPHIYSHDGRYLLRVDADGVIASTPLRPRELRRLMLERGELSFEAEVAHGASMADMNMDKVREYAAQLRKDMPGSMGDLTPEMVLLRRGCLVMREGKLRPTNAGILLFGKMPQMFVRGAEITAVRFEGDTMSDQFRRQDIVGTLPEQLRRAEGFLADTVRREVKLGKQMARQDNFEYPMEAARELVVNAIAHRDYSIEGDGTRLYLYRDRMEVASPGTLPGPITLENIQAERFSRNPIIVQVLSDMRFIERLGYGVDRVIALMQQQHLRPPEFSLTGAGFRVSLFNQRIESEAEAAVLAIPPQYRGIAINIRQEIALAHLRETNARITNSDLQRLCPEVHAETIRRDLADLVAKKILTKRGQKRGSYYILTSDESLATPGEGHYRG